MGYKGYKSLVYSCKVRNECLHALIVNLRTQENKWDVISYNNRA